jgi:hypothetical protein
MKPSQQKDVVPDGKVSNARCHVRVEHQPGIRRSFKSLLRCTRAIGKGDSMYPTGLIS